MKKETIFKIGAVTLLKLSISLFAEFPQLPKRVGNPILVKTTLWLPALLLAGLGNNFKKSVLSVSKQLKDVSGFIADFIEIVVDFRQIITNKQK